MKKAIVLNYLIFYITFNGLSKVSIRQLELFEGVMISKINSQIQPLKKKVDMAKKL